MPSIAEHQQFRDRGYVIRNILDADTVARYIAGVDAARSASTGRMMNLQFLQPGREVSAIQDVICHRALRETVTDLLGGGEAIIDGASLFYAEAGVDYRQGWHRDVMQVPDERIDPRWFRSDYFYNYVQVNIALTEDACLWIVPGSHTRALNAAERALFGENEKMAPSVEGELNDAIRVTLQPGEAAFYNNLAVHRGYAGVLTKRRITLQLGFHSNAHAPTFQFGVLDRDEYTDEYLATLAPPVRTALRAHLIERARPPEVDEYHGWHQQFITGQFVTR